VGYWRAICIELHLTRVDRGIEMNDFGIKIPHVKSAFLFREVLDLSVVQSLDGNEIRHLV
jgi:hypothetical protein